MNKEKVINALKQQTVLFILLFLFILLIIASPSFREPKNLFNLVRKLSIMGIISCGLTFPLVSGGLDLSVGSVYGLVGILAIMWQPKGLAMAIIIPLLIACAIGIFNGFIINQFNVSPIIVTLGMLSVIQGLILIITGGRNQIGKVDHPYSQIANSEWLGFNNQIVFFILITIILYILLQRTSFGRYNYLIGANPDAALISGIRIDRIRMLTYMVSALCAGIAAILLTSRVATARPYGGQGVEFEAITAVLIGGNSIGGGKGSIYNTILGVFMIAMIINGMVLIGLPYATQIVVKGLLLIAAVYIDARIRTRELSV